MRWREITDEELVIVNHHLKREEVTLTAGDRFTRYARKASESDKLVQFEEGVEFRLLKVVRTDNRDNPLALQLYQPREQLFLRLSSVAVHLMEADTEELLNSVFLDAIRKYNREQIHGDEETDFGIF